MQSSDFMVFKELWETYSDVINPSIKLSDKAIAVIFEKLGAYNLCDISAALDKLVERGVFALNVADVLNELKGGTNTDLEALANIAYNNIMSATGTYGEVRGYIFDHPAVNQTLNILGWTLTNIGLVDFDNDFRRKDFVKFFVNELKKQDNGVHTELKNENYCNETRLVSTFKQNQGYAVTWKLTPEQRDLILTNDAEGKKLIARITSVPPVYQLPNKPERDPTPPADIKRQIAALTAVFDAFAPGEVHE